MPLVIPSLRVTVEHPSDVAYFRDKAGYRVKLRVVEAEGIQPELFVHRVAAEDDCLDEFYSVAGPYDLVALPTQRPERAGEKFLKPEADFLITSVNCYDDTIRFITDSLRVLARSVTKLQTLSQAPDIIIN